MTQAMLLYDTSLFHVSSRVCTILRDAHIIPEEGRVSIAACVTTHHRNPTNTTAQKVQQLTGKAAGVRHEVGGHFSIKIDGFVPDCGISSALALEIPQSCTEPSRCGFTSIGISSHRNNFFITAPLWGNPLVTSGFPELVDSPHKGTMTQSTDVFFVVSLNKLLN